MAYTVEAGTPLAQAIQDAVQPKLMEHGWVADESDTTLAEYVTTMIVRGRDRQQIISELGTDLLGVGDDDPSVAQLTDWLLQEIPALDAQISGKPQDTGVQSQDMQMEDVATNTAPSGPKAMRNGAGRGRGRMLGQVNRHLDRGDDKMLRIRGAASGSGRINAHAGRDANRRNQPPSMSRPPTIIPGMEKQMQALLDLQNQMMLQLMGGQNGMNFNPVQQGRGKSLFERVDKTSRHQPDVEMGEDGQRKDPFDTLCRFNDKCTVATCPYAHQSPAAPSGTPVDLADRCSFGAACENKKCSGKHPSPAQRRQHLSQEVDCKFYPNCTNPACPFKHPDMPPCRNGADCTVDGCKFSHSKIMCRYNPCLNPGCVYKHVDGQKRGKFEDKVWTKEDGTADRLKSLADHQEQTEELIIPGNQVSEQPAEIIT